MATKVESKDIRLEKILPYISNSKGLDLESVLTLMDTKLSISSPEAMTPGLINWSNKGLFVDSWEVVSGTGTISYNPFGESKIGQGRYEINGTGKFVFNKFFPVSSVKGITGKIFIGASGTNSGITVGLECFNAAGASLGTNGGFLLNNASLPTTGWTYKRSSAYGELSSGANFLKPGTRFVKYFIEVNSNSNIIYFDESDISIYDLDERSIILSDTIIDWNIGEMFYTEALSNTTYSFQNDSNGRVKNLIVKNNSSGNIIITLPSNIIWSAGNIINTIPANESTIFTFVKANNNTYCTAVEGF